MAEFEEATKRRYHHGLWNRYFFSNLNTRLAMPWTRLFLLLRLHPNVVSLLSLAASVVGMYLIAFDPGPRQVVWVGGLLLMVGLWWDHSDGQVARISGKGSTVGALLDTVIDRWVETGWIIALAAGPFLGNERTIWFDWPRWSVVAIGAWAVHAQLYVRWANVQRDLYVIRKELLAAKDEATDLDSLPIDHRRLPKKVPDVKTFYIPIAFNRDLTLWMLFVVTLTPAWLLGLAVFAALHTLLGLEKNWYTYRDLTGGDTNAVQSMLDPDYHK